MVPGRQCRESPRSQKASIRDRASLGCGSLPEGEWDPAYGQKQKQVKGTSNMLRSTHGINTLFHFDESSNENSAPKICN